MAFDDRENAVGKIRSLLTYVAIGASIFAVAGLWVGVGLSLWGN
jgi:hypothetical protein